MLSRLTATRWLMTTVLGVTALSVYADAQKNPHKRDLRTEVVTVDRQWRAAELANDAVVMDKLLSDDYLGVMANGRLVTRTQMLQRMQDHQTEIRQLEFSDVKVKLLGNGAAIVTSLVQLDATMDGRTMQGMFRASRTYQRVPGAGWKLVHFDATQVRNPEALGAAAGR